MKVRKFKHKAGDIEWYCELLGSGATIVLIPSGEGDCTNFAKVANFLADEFTVLTFDMPGFSRSSTPPNFGKVTPQILADQVSALVTSLNLVPATFYGCSSGGQTALSLLADYPDIVRNIIVHEAALMNDVAWRDMAEAWFAQMNSYDDDDVMRTCKDFFRNSLNIDPKAWDELGAEYHKRLESNYVRWVRHYVCKNGAADRSYSAEELSKKPIAWSVGGFGEVWSLISNFRTAQRVNVEVEIFKCKHFPQVSIPDVLANHIKENTKKHLGGEKS